MLTELFLRGYQGLVPEDILLGDTASPEAVVEAFVGADADGSGMVDFEEFCALESTQVCVCVCVCVCLCVCVCQRESM